MPTKPASGGGNAGDVRAGGAYIEITGKDSLSEKLGNLRYQAQQFGVGMQKVGQKIREHLSPAGLKIAFAGLAGLAPLLAIGKGGADRAEDIVKQAEALGYTVEQMQRLRYAADVAAVSVEDVLRMPEKYAGLMAQTPVMDAATIRESVEANRALRAAWIDLQLALTPLVKTVGPLIRGFSEFVRRNADWLPVLATVAAGAVALGATLYALGPAIMLVGTAIKVALSPFALITAAVAGAGYGLKKLAEAVFPETASAAGRFFGDLGRLAADTFKGISAAIVKGDLGLALEIATAGALTVWKRFAAEMTYVWTRVKDGILDTFKDAVAGVQLLINDLGAWVLRNDFTGLIRGDLTDEQINAARDQIGNDIADDRAARAMEARTFRDKQIAEANAELEEARKRLAARIGQAVAGPAADGEPLARRITATRSAFRLLGDANQQFGRSDGIDTKQLFELVQIKKTLIRSEQLLVDAANNGRFK